MAQACKRETDDVLHSVPVVFALQILLCCSLGVSH
jgi:hypothetical protein